MKKLSGDELAKEIGCDAATLKKTCTSPDLEVGFGLMSSRRPQPLRQEPRIRPIQQEGKTSSSTLVKVKTDK